MKLLALLGIIHIFFFLTRRALEEGLFLISPGEMPYTAILMTGAGLCGYSITQSTPEHSLMAWVGIGIYVFALVIPALLVSWSTRVARRHTALWLARIASWLAPTHYHRALVRVYEAPFMRNDDDETDSETLASIEESLRQDLEEAQDEDAMVAAVRLVEFLMTTGRIEDAFRELDRLGSEDERFRDIHVLDLMHPVMKVRLMEGAVLAGHEHAFQHIFLDLLEDVTQQREGAGRAYLMASVVVLALGGLEKEVEDLLKGLEKHYPEEFPVIWRAVAKARKTGEIPEVPDRLLPAVEKAASFGVDEEFLTGALKYVLQSNPAREAARALREKTALPLATVLMVGAIIGFYVLEMFKGGPESPESLYLLGANVRYIPPEPWRFFTAWLLHGGIAHLLLNGYALWVLGKIIERHYGFAATWVIAIGSAVAGNAASYVYGAGKGYSVGASSAVFGLLGAGVVMLLVDRRYFHPEWRKQTLTTLMFWLVVNVVFGMSMPVIDNAAHLGGLAGGAVFAVLGARSLLGERRRMLLMVPLAITGIVGQAWGLLHVARNIMIPPSRNVKISGIEMTVPAYWISRQDRTRGEYLWSPDCSMIPTVKAIPIPTGGGAGDLNLAGLLEERLDLMVSRGGYRIKERHRSDHKPWFGMRTSGNLNGMTMIYDTFLRRYGEKALLFIEFSGEEKCAGKIRRHEQALLDTVRWPAMEKRVPGGSGGGGTRLIRRHDARSVVLGHH